jgi:hypothetical protein
MVWLPIANSEVLLAVYKSPGRAWYNADITELLSFRRKSILAGDLKPKHPFWNSTVSNPSGEKLMDLFDLNEFEISAPQCPIHYSPAGNGDMLDIWFNKKSECKGHCLWYSGLRSPTNSIPHTVSRQIRNLPEPIEKFRLEFVLKPRLWANINSSQNKLRGRSR